VKETFAWLTTRAERTSRLQKFRSYWVWRRRRENAEFRLYARLLNLKRSMRERRAAVGAAGTIAKTVAISVLAAVAVAVGLELLDRLVLQRASVLCNFLPNDVASRVARRFRHGAGAGELSLFGTVAQIAGIFLGLYFTAVSGIAAAVYADVPGEVRLLLTREKLGNVYIKLVAFLGALALTLSAAIVLRIQIGLLNVAVVGALSALSIFAFVMLGLRTFYFFSPDTLTSYVTADVVPLFEGSRRGRFGSKSRSISYNYQRQAEELLSTLRAVVGLSATRTSVTERSLSRIVLSNLRLLYVYEALKGDIESTSLWFKQRLEHPRWLTADHSSVDMALRTQTTIQGKQVGDRLWVERELHDVLSVALTALLQRPDRTRAVEAVGQVVGWTRTLASQLAVDETVALTQLVDRVIAEHLAQRPNDDRSVESVALADFSAALPMQIVLGMSDRLRPLTAETFAKATSRVDPLAMLDAGWPLEVVQQREYIVERLANERIVERTRLTADWYVAQLLALSMSRFFARVVPVLVSELEKIPPVATAQLDAGQTIIAAAAVQRGIEGCQKFAVHLGEFADCLERIAELRRAKDIPWVDTDWEDAQRRVSEVRTELFVLTARVSIEVSDVDTGGEIPDYFGGAYAFLAEECFDDLLNDRFDKFKRLFPAFFTASLSASERLRRELAGYDERTQILYSTETIEDLLDISGYALLKNELGHGECWADVKALWDKYLGNQDRAQFFTYLFAVLSYRGGIFAIKPRDIGRTSWQMAFRRQLEEQHLVTNRYINPFDLDDEELDVASPLVRAASGGAMGHKAGQAFVAAYLLTWQEAEGHDLPRSVEMFLESLEFAQRRDERDQEETEFSRTEPDPPEQQVADVGQDDADGANSSEGDIDA
jgi:hypothetical protein